MTTTTWTNSTIVPNQWGSNFNWDNGAPVPGDTVIVVQSEATTITGDIVQLTQENVTFNANLQFGVLTLTNTTMDGVSALSNFSNLQVNQLILDKTSSYGSGAATQPNTFVSTYTESIDNAGTLVATGDSVVGLSAFANGQLGDFINRGTILAANGGTVDLVDGHLHADRGTGSLVLGQQGTITMDTMTVDADQNVRFGGATGSTLAFDPTLSTMDARIFGFAQTDLIDIKGLVGTNLAVAASGKNTLVTVSGTNDVSSNPESVTLTFAGNVSHAPFETFTTTAPQIFSPSGTDTILTLR